MIIMLLIILLWIILLIKKISDKIRDIRAILSRLGNIVTKKDKKKIKKELYELENKNNLSDKKKKEICGHLVKLIETLTKKRQIQT